MKRVLVTAVALASGGMFSVAAGTHHESPGVLSIHDAWVAEGDEGTATLRFRVMLAAPEGDVETPAEVLPPVTVRWSTADFSARAGGDYEAATGTLSFESAGQLDVAVKIHGDRDTGEGSETFFLRLSDPTGALIEDGEAHGVIVDDDRGPLAATGRCDLDGNAASDVLVNYAKENEPTGHGAQHIIAGWGTSSTIAREGNALDVTTWNLVSAADFDGSGTCDLLWEKGDAPTVHDGHVQLALTLTRSGQPPYPPTPSSVLPTLRPGPQWAIVGAGNFIGNHAAELVWWNSDPTIRVFEVWSSLGGTQPSPLDEPERPEYLGPPEVIGTFSDPGNAGGEPIGVVDIDGGGPDILWRSAAGELTYLSMNGLVPQGLRQPLVPSARIPDSWTLGGVGDFNGDGWDDLLFDTRGPHTEHTPEHPSGPAIIVWFLRGSEPRFEGRLSPDRFDSATIDYEWWELGGPR